MVNEDFIETLIISELTGNITAEEKSLLDKLLAEEEDVRKLYNDIQSRIKREDAVRAINRLPFDPPVPNPEPSGIRKIVRLHPLLSGVVAMLTVIFSVFIITNSGRQSQAEVKVAALTKESIRLTLANKKVFNLDSMATDNLLTGVQLHRNADTLSWSVKTDINKIWTADPDFCADGLVTINTPSTRHYSMILRDGTKMRINAATEIEFSFTGNSREVWLKKGEIYLDVTHDPSKKFVVHLTDADAVVLGTTLNIRHNNGQQKVSLINGKVKLLTSKDSTVLKPGFEAMVQKNGRLVTDTFKIADVTAWKDAILRPKNGILKYENARIEELKTVIREQYNVEMKVSSTMRNDKFFGSINYNKPLQEFLDVLKATNEVNYVRKKDTLYIIKNN